MKPLALCGHVMKHEGVCIAFVNRYVFLGESGKQSISGGR